VGGGSYFGADGLGEGGAIYLVNSSLTIKTTTFSGDTASTAGDNVFTAV
jgi:hypothetical protein